MGHVRIYRTRTTALTAVRTRNRWLFLVGVSISGLALYLALRKVEWAGLGATLANVNSGGLASCAALVTLGIILRGWRWSLIADQTGASRVSYARAVNLGLLGNQLLPGRVGEIVRVFALMRLLPTGLGTALSSAVLDRAVDVLVLLLSAWWLTASLARTVVPGQWLALLGGTLLALLVTVAIVRSEGFRLWLAAKSERWLHRWALRPEAFLPTFNSMFRRSFQPLPAMRLVLAASALLLVDYLTVEAALGSVGLDLPREVPLLLWVALAASSALPSAPGYVGVYQLAAIWSLASYEVSSHQAIAVAFVLQGVTLAVSVLGIAPELIKLLQRSLGRRA